MRWTPRAISHSSTTARPRGKAYLAAQEKAKSAKGHEALEAAIYNHLYAFFSRYWQDGDFISKRRYSKKERYAIPYNGEEVTLYWANHDQYYVKTGEYFTDYSWQAPNGVSVHFKLKAADVEQNNVKGEKRFFLPALDGITWDETSRTLIIPCEFRPLTQQEQITYGQRNQQETIIAKALAEIPKRIPKEAPEALAALSAEKSRADGTSIPLLEHHLRQYSRRNTSDFFIHKDLKGFLSRELDFYLKNEVLNLEEMEAAGEKLGEGWFQLLRLIKKVGGRIIEFLAQIEDFQKMLWEKRKFVTETFYCITLGQIEERFYPEIAACEAQWEEWKGLRMLNDEGGRINQTKRLAFLKEHPSLPIDTRRFDPPFVDQLLASFADPTTGSEQGLEEMTDGLLVHGENWQALDLLAERYQGKVKSVYIDPPYNTGGDGFLYKDTFQHSSWITMMNSRLECARNYLAPNGSISVSIDDHETSNLVLLLGRIFSPENFVGTAVWKRTVSRPLSGGKILTAHDYVITYQRTHTFEVCRLNVEDEDQYKNPDNDLRGPYKLQKFERTMSGVRPTMTYTIETPTGPVTRTWSGPRETYDKLIVENRIVFSRSGLPQYKQFLVEMNGQLPSTWWQIEGAYNQNASLELQELLGVSSFETAKPIGLLDRILRISGEQDSICMDFFAGSGTTGHAVINLNREDGGRRKFILAEMADYFDSVLLPRLKKVTFTPEWKDGKPKRMATSDEAERSPRIVKVIRLESYEDTLNNLAFDEAVGQQVMKFDDYLLQYMLRWETRHSETLLKVEKLDRPFSYQLHLHRDGETKLQPVDLPETFNYLIGLYVDTRRVLDNQGWRYLVYRGMTREGRKTAVIWRETEDWTEEDYARDRQFVAEHQLTKGADEVFVNGDSLISGARALEPLFKARMFAGVEA